jgi:hypothetical protein
MFKEVTLQNIWESDMPVENGSTFKIKSTLWWPVLVEGLKMKSPVQIDRISRVEQNLSTMILHDSVVAVEIHHFSTVSFEQQIFCFAFRIFCFVAPAFQQFRR